MLLYLDIPPARTLSQSSVEENPGAVDHQELIQMGNLRGDLGKIVPSASTRPISRGPRCPTRCNWTAVATARYSCAEPIYR